MALSDEVKAATSLVALAAETVTWDLHKSDMRRGDWWAPCPFHAEKSASFHVTEPKGAGGQFYCFGCHKRGSAIDFLMERDGLSFAAAVKTLADAAQVERTADPVKQEAARAAARKRQEEAEARAERAAAYNLDRARALWRAAVPGHPALADYLTGRGIDVDALGGVPPSLRFVADLPAWGSAEDGRRVQIHSGPAMVGFIGRGRLFGVHRTWIDGGARARLPDGRKVPKSMLGLTGSIFGRPCPLTPSGGDALVVGEGIETTLAGLLMMRRKRPDLSLSAEAALSLPAMAGPEDPQSPVEFAADGSTRLPSPRPDLSGASPGWLPPEGTRDGWVLADPSAKAPEAAKRNALRALAKFRAHLAPGGPMLPGGLLIPRGRWDHDDDFADLARLGELPG